MSVNASLCGIGVDPEMFQHAPVRVKRWRVSNCDVHQTIYFPSIASSLYRASITGDLLIAEYVQRDEEEDCLGQICSAFGIHRSHLRQMDSTTQRFGKIAAVDNDTRKRIIRHLTLKHNVYSLGRFATWRNILLDDVLQDVYVIKRLLNSNEYDAARIAAE